MLARHLMTTVAAVAATLSLGGGVLAQDTPTVTIIAHDNPGDAELFERIEAGMADAGTPVNIELVGLPSSGYADALSLRLLSGEIPDIIYFQGADAEFANQGILEDLGPWIEQSEHIQNAMWPHNEARMENYPYLLYIFPARTKSAVMRSDWLEQSGLDAPTNLDEWTAFLTEMSQSDFDGNGEQDTYGILAPDNTAELDAIFNQSFGVSATWLEDENGEWIHSRVSDAERDKLAYYQMLYAEGILDPEYVTSNWEVKEDKFYSGRVAVIMGTAGPVVEIYKTKMAEANPGADLA
ncbi:extracellular solute-binding protein, partial [uncultured Pelagibacterium sp.]